MNDMDFIEVLKTKRNACGYSQSRLAKELHISRLNLEKGEADLEGQVDSMIYSAKGQRKKKDKNLLHRVLD